jgi:hypothetical protein
MKHLALDWGAFLSGLETWEQLSPADRQTFLELPPNRLIRTVEVGAPAKTLVRSGLLAPVGDGRNLRVAKPFLPLHRGLNGIGLLPVFAEPDEATLESYLTLHFSADECGKLIAQGGRYSNRRQTVARVTTVEWLESFREAKDPIAWEKKHSGGGGLLCFAEPPVAPALRAIIDYLLATDSPCPLRDLARELSRPSSPAQPAQPALGLSRPVLGKALYAGLRYLLLFPSLFQGFHPVVGLWPPLAKRLHQPVPSAPSPVEPEETCPADFAVFDMIAVLAACAVEPQRVRSNDLSLFARARDTLAALQSPLPEWVHEV